MIALFFTQFAKEKNGNRISENSILCEVIHEQKILDMLRIVFHCQRQRKNQRYTRTCDRCAFVIIHWHER